MDMELCGLVLAGGESSRFGGDKALAVLGEQSLLQRAIDALCPLASCVAISVAPGSASQAEAQRLGCPVLFDRHGLARGPLLGILAGLDWSARLGARWMASLPCDVVRFPADAFPRLQAAAVTAKGAYAITPKGPQSLCAVWPVQNRIMLETALSDGIHPPVHEALKLMGAKAVDFREKGMFLNINTKDQLDAAEKLFKPGF